MDLSRLEQTLAERGEPPYRLRQVWERTARGAAGYGEMTSLPAALRASLAEAVPFSTLELVAEASSRDGTVKALFRTHEGHPVEAVLMRYRDGRRSICLSSQSGCPLTCTFCATGQMRFTRNLTSSEMLDQALHFRRLEPVDHAVFMGMGEPMLNLDPVVAAARRLPDLGVTHRRTTISTVGWLPGLRRFVDEVEEPIRLAFSLHAPNDALRSELMPVNDRYPLADVLAECERYFALRRRKVFVEYVLLRGVNDRVEQARELAALLDRRVYKVNLIPYNPIGAYDGSTRRAIAAFKDVLDRARLPATVRLTRGRDIAAACGQLAAHRVTVFAFYGTFTSGQPGHGSLAGARFLERVRTAPRYRLYFVDERWPALVPDADGRAIECELYECSEGLLARLARVEPPGWKRAPLVLADGRRVEAFLGDPELAARGVDVSDSGSWAAFTATPARPTRSR